MNKLAGEVLDFYDDPQHIIFRERFPDPSLLPDYIKTAHLLTEEEREVLPDDLFSLVLEDGDKSLKKYARNDKANTAISVVYFLDNGVSKIPSDMAKLAATNLVQGCGWYQIKPPEELLKIAAEGEDDRAFVLDHHDPRVDASKTAALGAVVESKIMGDTEEEKYPLDSYADVQAAIPFFEKYASRFHPRKRRMFARNLQKRADELHMPTSQSIQLYASEEFTDKNKLAEQIHLRMQKTSGVDQRKYQVFFEKCASVTPGAAGEALSYLDEETGLDTMWDGTLLDPYASLLNHEKRAENYAFHDTVGSISDEDIHRIAVKEQSVIEKALGKDFYQAFKDDPVTIFKSLPTDEKKVLIRVNAGRSLSNRGA